MNFGILIYTLIALILLSIGFMYIIVIIATSSVEEDQLTSLTQAQFKNYEFMISALRAQH